MSEINPNPEFPAPGETPFSIERRSVETIFYFHGYNGYLTNEKREVLQQFGKVIAPTFNYGTAKTLPQIIDSFKDVDLQSAIFMGTSFGGYVISVLNEKYDIPGLLFNPALPYRIMIEPGREHHFEKKLDSLSYFVLGKQDKLVRCQDNLDYISKYVKGPKDIIINEALGHSIPVMEFEMYTKRFLEKVGKK